MTEMLLKVALKHHKTNQTIDFYVGKLVSSFYIIQRCILYPELSFLLR